MKIRNNILLRVGVIGLIAVSCGTETDINGNGNGTDNDTDPPVVEYSLEAVADPVEGGSVNPSSGEFEEGEQVNVEATSNQGWEFINWSGDLESEDNPLIFIIDQYMSLTAHFLDMRSEYSVTITVADAESEVDELGFGQHVNPSSQDQPAPPNPPQGALDAWFDRDEEKLYKDYRSELETEVSWHLHYQPGSGEQLSLSWTIDADKMNGLFNLQGDDGAVLIEDMSAEDTFEFDTTDYQYLVMQYVNK